MVFAFILTFIAVIIAAWYINHKYSDRHLGKYKGPPPMSLLGNVLYFKTTHVFLVSVKMVFEFILTITAVIIAAWYINHKYSDRHLGKYKGPTPIPLLGNVLYFSTTHDIMINFMKFPIKYGNIFKFCLGFSPSILVISDAKFLEYLLGSSKFIEKSDDYRPFHRWLGSGLLTSGGDKWRKSRKMITPAYHFKILEQFTDIFDHYSNILVEKLKKEVGNKSTNIYPYITLSSLDIICATSMGTSVNAQENSESNYIKSVKEMCRIVIVRNLSLFEKFDFTYKFTKDYKIELKSVKTLHDYTNSVIKMRTKQLEKEKLEDIFESEDVGNKKKTFLDLLLSCKEQYQLTDENIREEVDTFMFEGHDTTSSAVTFILYCLSINPEAQKQVMEELENIFAGDIHRMATYKDLQEMKYLEKVIKESLRLYPSVPIYTRTIHEQAEYDGSILPKNLTIYVNVMALHRDPEIYPDPEKFDPERFTNENASKRSPYAYIPFSAGPRNCIGQKFAMLEMKAIVSKVLKNYELLPSEPQVELVLVPESILKSSSGVHIQLRNRIY